MIRSQCFSARAACSNVLMRRAAVCSARHLQRHRRLVEATHLVDLYREPSPKQQRCNCRLRPNWAVQQIQIQLLARIS